MRCLGLRFLCLLGLSACTGDETLSGYATESATWSLTELDGKPFGANATLIFPGQGRIAGAAPCNSFSGDQKAPYPWFEVGQTVSTKMACPELPLERAYLQALTEMTLAEVSGPVLILSNMAGRKMVFSADQP